MAKKVLFEVRELSTDPAFQIVEDSAGIPLIHYGATYLTETPVYTGARFNANGTEFVSPTGQRIAALPLDVNNNVVANIIPRTGLLGNTITTGLLSLAGGAGEVSVATDKLALVLHNGVAGGAKTLYRSATSAEAIIYPTAAAIPTGAAGLGIDLNVYTDLNASSAGNDGIIINNEIVVPSDGPAGVQNGALAIQLDIVFGVSAVGTVRRVGLEFRNTAGGTTWTQVYTRSVPVVASARLGDFIVYPFTIGEAGLKYRLRVYQDSGAAMDLNGNFGAMSVALHGV